MGHSARDRDLHYQIEQLLMSVSQLQRQNSELEAALQKQREDRHEDHHMVRSVIDKMRNKSSSLAPLASRQSRRRTTITSASSTPTEISDSPTSLSEETLELVDTLESRFPVEQYADHRTSSMFETKQMLRENLARAKEQLSSETMRATALARDLNERDAELQSARDALKETRQRLAESYNANQRQEKTIQELRRDARKMSAAASWTAGDSSPDTPPSLSRSTTSDSISGNGLREFRLGRTPSQKSIPPPREREQREQRHSSTSTSIFGKRSSSLATQTILATENHAPADNESLLMELVNAKTAEAVARQELEELKARFEGMKRVMSGGSPVATPGVTPSATPAAMPKEGTQQGWGWGGWKRTVSSGNILG